MVTPGVSFNDNVLKVKHNNYLASVYFNKNTVGIAFLDISTGEFLTAQGDQPYIDKLIQGFQPAEVLFCKTQREIFDNSIREDFNTFRIEDWVYSIDYSYEKLTGHFGTNSLKGFGIENLKEGIIAAGAILYYLEITEHHEVSHISNISRIEEDKFVWLDKFTIRNLELVYPQHEGGVPLIDILDHCVTPMGARMMKKWVVLPLKSKSAIENRLNTVAYFSENEEEIEDFLQPLQQIGDLERLISKVAVGRINPRELNHLKRALKNTIPIKTLLLKSDQQEIKLLADKINLCEQLIEKIDQTLVDNPPLLSNQGGIIKEGLDAELDDLRKIAFSGKDYLVQIQQREMERTGIPSLKIAYNKVFGYYLEVTNAHKDKVPPEWIRKQTLVNAERYITEELKVYEEKILNAEGQIFIIEQKLFQNLVVAANEFVVPIQQNAIVLAMLDCYISFAGIALKNQYIKPEISEGKTLAIREGRHPVIEQQLPPGENYIPNDIRLDDVFILVE